MLLRLPLLSRAKGDSTIHFTAASLSRHAVRHVRLPLTSWHIGTNFHRSDEEHPCYDLARHI